MADPIFSPAADAAIASGAGKTTVAAGMTAGVTGWASNMGLPSWLGAIDWVSAAGLLVALIGLFVSWKFKRRQDEREAKAAADAHTEHIMRMHQMELESQMRREPQNLMAQVDE